MRFGPHPVLLGMGSQSHSGLAPAWLPSLHRDRSDWQDLVESLQRLYSIDGATPDVAGFERDYPRTRVSLPTYPFRRRRHWTDVVSSQIDGAMIWPELKSALDRHSLLAPLDFDAASYPQKWQALTRVATAIAVVFFRNAGCLCPSANGARATRSLQWPRSALPIGI